MQIDRSRIQPFLFLGNFLSGSQSRPAVPTNFAIPRTVFPPVEIRPQINESRPAICKRSEDRYGRPAGRLVARLVHTGVVAVFIKSHRRTNEDGKLDDADETAEEKRRETRSFPILNSTECAALGLMPGTIQLRVSFFLFQRSVFR